jgi:hypothetical protein
VPTVKPPYPPADLPCLVARLPFASYRMSCHTASGRQGRGCAELNRSKAIQKRCASCGSKGTFDFRLSFFPGKFLMRIRRRTTPSGRQGGQSASRLPHLRCSTSLAQRMGHPGYRGPVPCRWASSLRAVICRRLLPSVLPLNPSGCVNGNRETQRECFQALRVHGWQSQALCRPFKTIHGEFPHPHQPSPPATPFNAADVGLGGLAIPTHQTAKPDFTSQFS